MANSGQISVTPEQLIQQATVYSRASQDIRTTIGKVESMNTEIGQEWQGQAFQAYLEQFNSLKVSVTKMEELLESINTQLKSYANTVYQRVDRHDIPAPFSHFIPARLAPVSLE